MIFPGSRISLFQKTNYFKKDETEPSSYANLIFGFYEIRFCPVLARAGIFFGSKFDPP